MTHGFLSQNKITKHLKTRMHSSGMRTARLLTVSKHALPREGVYPSMHWAGGVCAQGGGRHPPREQND